MAQDVPDRVADLVQRRRADGRLRVAVDGITAAGKTTFADALGERLARRGLPVLRVSLDGFHHPRAHRYRQGRADPAGYYEDAYDFTSVRRLLLDPLGPGGDGRFRRAVIDLATDTPVDDAPEDAAPGTVLVMDGSFLQKPEVRDGWDLVVFLRSSFTAAAARGIRRDAPAFGGAERARAAFEQRYHPAHERYLRECDPERRADAVIDNEDPTRPRLLRLGRRVGG